MKRGSRYFFWPLVLTLALGLVVQGCGGGGSKKSPVGGGGTGGTGTGSGTGTGGGNPGDAVGIDFTIDVPSSADSAWVEAFKGRLNEVQGRMWTAFEGQMYMKNVTIEKGGQNGKVNIDPLQGSWTYAGSTKCRGFSYSTWMQLPGEFLPQAWLHEWNHCFIGKFPNEEYNCDDASNDVCIMNVVKAPPNERWHYCDQGNCLVGGSNGVCWENWFLKKYSSWKHPNTGFSQTPPSATITVK